MHMPSLVEATTRGRTTAPILKTGLLGPSGICLGKPGSELVCWPSLLMFFNFQDH